MSLIILKLSTLICIMKYLKFSLLVIILNSCIQKHTENDKLFRYLDIINSKSYLDVRAYKFNKKFDDTLMIVHDDTIYEFIYIHYDTSKNSFKLTNSYRDTTIIQLDNNDNLISYCYPAKPFGDLTMTCFKLNNNRRKYVVTKNYKNKNDCQFTIDAIEFERYKYNLSTNLYVKPDSNGNEFYDADPPHTLSFNECYYDEKELILSHSEYPKYKKNIKFDKNGLIKKITTYYDENIYETFFKNGLIEKSTSNSKLNLLRYKKGCKNTLMLQM